MGASGTRAFLIALAPGALAACSLLTSYDGLVPAGASGPEGGVDGGGADVVEPGDSSDVRDVAVPRDVATPDVNLIDAGTCEAGLAPCGAVCVDLSSDPANCGACGHDCLGGGCASGACQPVTVATGGSPGVIAIAGATLYWGDTVADTITVGAASPADGGAGPSVYHHTQHPVLALAVDPPVTTLYWLESDQINQCALGPTCATTVNSSLPTPLPNLPILFIDSSGIYWPDGQDEVLECPLSGCANGNAGSFFFTGSATNPVSGLALSGGIVYWGGKSLLESCPDGTQCSTATALPPALADVPTELFATATTLYFSVDTGVNSCALPSCPTVTTVASNEQQPSYIVADANAAYWIDKTGLFGCVNGCAAPANLFSGTVGGLTIDGSAVYWTVPGQGKILKVAR
jgi:hypothetical protein